MFNICVDIIVLKFVIRVIYTFVRNMWEDLDGVGKELESDIGFSGRIIWYGGKGR